MAKYKSSSLERCIQLYPKPRYYMMFEAERSLKFDVGPGEHAKKIIELYYDSKPDIEQKHLMELYNKTSKKK